MRAHHRSRLSVSMCLKASAVCLALIGCQPAGELEPAPSMELVHMDGLGSLSFPNSANEAAQDPFLRGVLLLHSFEFEQAAEAFQQAQEADPEFALGYWGEAMSHNHPLWREKDHGQALAALKRLAPTAAERRAKAVTEREKMYMDAVEVLYQEGAKSEADRVYAEAMDRLRQAHPGDLEAAAFYALAVLGTRDGNRDFATYVRAAAVAQTVFEANPDHPGAAHYLIHSFDDPVHAPLGLPAAREYSKIAPNAAHAQHMTTHIFVALGMWDDVIAGNIRARDTQDAQFAELGRPVNYCGHYSSWLQYGHLQIAEDAKATALLDLCHGRMSESPTVGEQGYFASMRARQIVDSQDWSLASNWTAELEGRPALIYEVTNAFAALRAGDTAPAERFVAEYEAGFPAIQVDQLRGLIAIAAGDADAGLDLLKAAAVAEDALPFEFGPPRFVKPTFELHGEELLRVERFADADAALRRAIERTPGRALAVSGLEVARTAARK